MQAQNAPSPQQFPHQRIYLALSGGGFRASIFHLGVIRRLEELGIMQDMEIVSAVSGGSILGAFYACEMENLLARPDPADPSRRLTREEAYKLAARKFLDKVDLNMRSRALVFTPFYHLPLFLFSLVSRPFRQDARSVLIQKEYDKHFYHDDTLDQLPAVPPSQAQALRAAAEAAQADQAKKMVIFAGPKLLLNTTSLMTGERREFSRDANARLAELKTSDKNVLKLSRVVGASAGVPGLFPPTSICGELLVDGGVSDNQGIEGLLEPILRPPSPPPQAKSRPPGSFPCHGQVPAAPVDPKLLHYFVLISDASQQLELKHRLSTSMTSVLSRVNDILQHQVRSKLLKLVEGAYNEGLICFSFVHLLLNLADAGIKDRLPVEYIEGVARVRTDLDQFSYIEREALMYHGYTLIDAMVKRWCTTLIEERFPKGDIPRLRCSPLFMEPHNEKQRELIKKELAAGAQNLFLARTWEKYAKHWKSFTFYVFWVFWLVGFGAAVALTFGFFSWFPFDRTRDVIARYIAGPLPTYLIDLLEKLAGKLAWTDFLAAVKGVREFVDAVVFRAAELSAVLVLVGLPFYIVTFFFWAGTRHIVRILDRRRYRKIAGPDADPDSLDWKLPPDGDRPNLEPVRTGERMEGEHTPDALS